jgi:hypothetical protein
MNVRYPCLDVEAANDISMSPYSTGTKKKFEVGVADWLSLAAAPTFAIMALLTVVLGGGPLDMLCSAAQDASPLTGMVPMYLLMSAFHSAPWLKLIASRRSGAHERTRGGRD